MDALSRAEQSTSKLLQHVSILCVQALGIQMPPSMDLPLLVKLVGLQHRVHALDVATQGRGGRMTMGRSQIVIA